MLTREEAKEYFRLFCNGKPEEAYRLLRDWIEEIQTGQCSVEGVSEKDIYYIMVKSDRGVLEDLEWPEGVLDPEKMPRYHFSKEEIFG